MPSPEAIIDRAFVELLGKARRKFDDELRRQSAQPREATINIMFSGGGAVLPASGMPGLVEVPYACIPTWCHMYAGNENGQPVVVTAEVSLAVTSAFTFGQSVPMNGVGLPPQLLSASSAINFIDGWVPSLLAQEAIVYRLVSFSGQASWLSVNIGIRAIEADQVVPVVDSTGDFVVDDEGNTVILRG